MSVALNDIPKFLAAISEDADLQEKMKSVIKAMTDGVGMLLNQESNIDWPLLRDPRLLYQLHAGPYCGSHFRLFGPHANYKMARKVLMHARSPTYAFRFLDFGLAECARILGLKQYQSRLSILGRVRPSDDARADRVGGGCAGAAVRVDGNEHRNAPVCHPEGTSTVAINGFGVRLWNAIVVGDSQEARPWAMHY